MRKIFHSTQCGSVIITILVMLVLISLGIGITLMFSSSSLQVAQHNIQLKASNLAQAGIRYAAGEYRAAGDLAAKFNRLEQLHQEQVTLLNNDGTFQLSIFPYWFVTTGNVNNSTSVPLKVLGKFPTGFGAVLPSKGNVKIMNDFYAYSGGSTSLGIGNDSDQFTITLDRAVTLEPNVSVQLAWAPPSSQTIVNGGNIIVFTDADQGLEDIFPARNGLFEVFSHAKELIGIYRYKERIHGSVVLSGVTAVDDSPLPITVSPSSRVVIKKQAIVQSIGSMGTGNLASSKGLELNVFLTDELFVPSDTPAPLDLGGGGTGKQDNFDDETDGHTQLDNWEFDRDNTIPESQKKTITTHEIVTEFGDSFTSSNYVTFQNFTQVQTDKGYTADLIDKARLPEAVRTKNLNGIWGNASDNIYFVGDDGTIVHYDGTDFISMISTSTQDLNAIWGLPTSKSSPDQTDNIFVVGDNGETLINEGDGWIHATQGQTYDIYAAWGTSWGHFDGYGEAGTNPYNWDSANTAQYLDNYNYYISEFGGHVNFRSLWAIRHTYPYNADYGATGRQTYQNIMVGEFFGGSNNGDGIIMHEFYEPAVIIADTPLRGVWGSSFSNIYAVGDGGAIYQNTSGNAPDYEGTGWRRPRWEDTWQGQWRKISAADVPTTKNLNGVYGNSATDFYVIGDDGTILYNKGNGFELVPTADVTTQTLNSIWGSDRTGIYAVGNNGTIVFLGYPANQIGGLVLPLSKNNELAAQWSSTQKFLSYTIQAKTVWGDSLAYGASGICFRWHQPQAGKYAGYGISFVRYDSSQNGVNDLIPDAIKPGFHGTNELNDRLLLVLWEQYVQGGAEQRRWIAYKDISSDSKVVKASNGSVRDLSSLIVRVHEKKVEGLKVNDIQVYYGNASASNQTADNVYNNTVRNEYNPTFGTLSNSIKWPVFNLDNWKSCPDGPDGITCEQADSFTLVDNVSVSANPVASTESTQYWIVNPSADQVVLMNGITIRASRFTTPDGDSFGSQSDRSEIGLHVYGDIGDYGTQSLVSFADFAVQLGVKTDAQNSESSFGSLQ
ncbi:MAG: hypothetical protein ABIJ31_07115 [Pseudomonadota bacterium]